MLLPFFVSTPPGATSVRLEYSVVDLGAGTFQYEFSLILDNHDGTWTAGQAFNWIIFGDIPGPYASPLQNWVGDPADLPIGPFTFYGWSGGEHHLLRDHRANPQQEKKCSRCTES